MKKFQLMFLLISFFLIPGCICNKSKNESIIISKEQTMTLTSVDFSNGGNLPEKYTCDGEGTPPEIAWTNYPSETKSFALAVEDSDAPGGNFIHWMVANIPSNITSTQEASDDIPGATNISNDFGKTGYGAPCPPSQIHRYIFKIFALNTDKIDGINKENFYDKIKPYVISEGTLTGKYGK